jgi:hypothetical protein
VARTRFRENGSRFADPTENILYLSHESFRSPLIFPRHDIRQSLNLCLSPTMAWRMILPT